MITAHLPAIPTFDDWRGKARELIATNIAPDQISWSDADLFSVPSPRGEGEGGEAKLRPSSIIPSPNPLPSMGGGISVPRAFIDLARKAVLHTDPERFALLYRILWRLQQNRALIEDAADPDIVKLNALAKAVRRDEHKMHAFVRFKEIAHEEAPLYVAWFEPQHRPHGRRSRRPRRARRR